MADVHVALYILFESEVISLEEQHFCQKEKNYGNKLEITG
jgi:hypothetical protein